MTKTKVAPKPEKITDAVLDNELSSLMATNIKEEAEKALDKKQLHLLKRLAYYVGKVGIELNEACLLLGVDPDKFRVEMEAFPIIRKVIDMKELEYKKDLMATLSARARAGDDKIALWLLEMKDPDKYGKKKGGGGDDNSGDILATAIEFVQSSNDGSGLIKKTSGRALIIKGPAGEKKINTTQLLDRIHRIAQ